MSRLYFEFPKNIDDYISMFTENGILYLEVKFKNNQIMLCDIQDYNLIKSQTWNAYKSGNHYYCYNSKKELFHRLIHPEWKIIDHINRNGLDNRRFNLRDGTNGVNERNRKLYVTNTSGINGLSYEEKMGRWQFHWREQGKTKKKNFYGARDNEEVKKRAIEFKQQIDKKLDNRNGYDIN
jgi:AP2 domain